MERERRLTLKPHPGYARRVRLLLALSVLPVTLAYADPLPWPRTETREPCANSDPHRRPFFGDLHVHTRFSADAYIFGTRTEPDDAYAFARGGTIPMPDANEEQTRTASLDRPLDFAAVTDHAEFFGEAQLCQEPTSVPYDFLICELFRQKEPPGDRGLTIINWLFPAGIPDPPPSLPFCSEPMVDCDGAAVSVWQTMQAAAEAAYDRSSACSFTTFIGYENTASPFGAHRHRNVIFRNHVVPGFAASHLETEGGGVPQGLWTALDASCFGPGAGCDAVIIPHNPNLSGGQQWEDPLDAADALRRQVMEPLVEMHQVKGNSECRFDRLAGVGLGTSDELCDFEQLPNAQEGPAGVPVGIDEYPSRNVVRNTLKDGLLLEQTLGANPWKMGFIGSTDTHDASPGAVDEPTWPGAQGSSDASPANMIANDVRTNPGGLAVVWAEENSRDALFEGLRRRETYATSGTRPAVRFFAGDLQDVTCGASDFVSRAYATGTAMGGDLGPVGGKKGPRFAVWAQKDPGSVARPGTDLERVQIVKGWVDGDGVTHEAVFDVAGEAASPPGVDLGTCAPVGGGAPELCTVWRDPDYDPQVRAFYYARVLERPSCRWSTWVCKAAGVDPFANDCPAQAEQAGDAFADCCLGPGNDASIDPIIQERAWTSPVWARPDGITRVKARIRRGDGEADDGLRVSVAISAAAELDVLTNDLTLSVADGASVWSATIPAGAFRARGRSMTVFRDRAGAVSGLRRVVLSRTRGGLRLRFEASGVSLGDAPIDPHPLTVSIASGLYRATFSRFVSS